MEEEEEEEETLGGLSAPGADSTGSPSQAWPQGVGGPGGSP